MHNLHSQPTHWIAWNILLAVIPAVAAYLLAAGVEHYKPRGIAWLIWLPLALAWFAFLPNTCYLLTEWRHLLFDPFYKNMREGIDTPAIRLKVAEQTLFFMGYSGIGVLCYTLAIRPIERMLRRTRVSPLLLAPPFFFLTSLGVYMGLIRRLNSWQVATQPRIVWDVAVHALTNPLLLEVIAVFAVLLWLLYEFVDIWIDGIMQRLGRGGSPSTPPASGKRKPKS